MPLDFHASIEALSDLQMLVTEVLRTNFRMSRRLVCGPGFERMRVAS